MVAGILDKRLKIKSQEFEYEVQFLSSKKDLKSNINNENYFFIIDKFIYENFNLIHKRFNKNIVLIKKPNEKEKTISTVEVICNELVKKGANRTSTLVGIGGGYIQDLSQFTSKIFHRGTDLILVPTTLLSIADSCIGGKCGINLTRYKNQLGIFKSPNKVLIYSNFVNTLDNNQLIDGYGEILKLLITKNKSLTLDFLNFLNSEKMGKLDNFILNSLISKKKIIEIDEFEKNLRRILNYGHTFAHALETLSSNRISHGHAVGFGINLANYISYKLNLLDIKVFQEIYDTSKKVFDIPKIALKHNFSGENYFEIIKNDKKSEKNFTNFILCENYGKLIIKKLKLDKSLAKLIDDFYILNA
jgi:3-dehydroquinate synthase